MKQLLLLTCVLSTLLAGCVVDSSEIQPDSTHMLIITVDKITANGGCDPGGAEVHTEIELFISTRDKGTPFSPDAKEEYEPLIFTSLASQSPGFTLETDFALADEVLVEARIITSDERHPYNPDEDFWHGSYYNASKECWIDDRWLNFFVAPGCHDGGIEYTKSHETSMAYGFGCKVSYEWTVRVEEL